MPFENLLNISVKKDWVDYLSAMLTPTVAIFGLYIGYRQWRTEEAKLRHELFERRYKQFDAVGKFVASVSGKDAMTLDEEIEILSIIAEMNFIFDEEITCYVKSKIWRTARDIHVLQSEIKQMTPDEGRFEKRHLLELDRTLHENLDGFKKKTLKYMQLQQPSLPKKLWRNLAALWEKIQNAAE
jgi:hypothetical protein